MFLNTPFTRRNHSITRIFSFVFWRIELWIQIFFCSLDFSWFIYNDFPTNEHYYPPRL